MDVPLRELSLFTGSGGGILASRILGWNTVCAVEIEEYCRQVLVQRQREGWLERFPIWDDVQTFDGNPWRGRVDIVTAGFPCPAFSLAGKRRGDADNRNLWPDTIRVIEEVQPQFIYLENVPGLLSSESRSAGPFRYLGSPLDDWPERSFRYYGEILWAIAEAGYDAEWKVVSAADCGAPHLRRRLWIVGRRMDNSDSDSQGNGS